MISYVLKAILLFQCLIVTDAFFLFASKVDCSVTGWSPWSPPNSDGKQTRVRRIMRHPRNGGKPCPPLIEARDSVICQVTPWTPWSANFGFGQISRLKAAIPQLSSAGKSCTQIVEEVKYTGKVPSVNVTAKNFESFFVRPNGLRYLLALSSVNRLTSMQTVSMPRDLVLIMDSSGSIGSVAFADAKRQISRLIGLLCPNRPFDKNAGYPYQYNQAAMLTYSTYVIENFNFNTYDTTVKIQNAILNAKYEGRMTNTNMAFDRARGLFAPFKGARNAAYVKREVLILTDGRSTNRNKTFEAVEILKREADVYGLMIGKSTLLGWNELTQYVSTPKHKHLFYLEGFGDLANLVNAIQEAKSKAGLYWCAPFNP